MQVKWRDTKKADLSFLCDCFLDNPQEIVVKRRISVTLLKKTVLICDDFMGASFFCDQNLKKNVEKCLFSVTKICTFERKLLY